VEARHKFLLPVKALGAHLRTLFKKRLLKKHPGLFDEVPTRVWKRGWIVDCRPAGSGENALRYLSRERQPREAKPFTRSSRRPRATGR
jgi:hypothetical protein